jgi:Mitochondrial calcium uniporter
VFVAAVGAGALDEASIQTLLPALDLDGRRIRSEINATQEALDGVNARLAEMEAVAAGVSREATKQVWRLAVSAGSFMVAQYGLLFYLIYDWGWDVVEPIGALVGATQTASLFAFFIFTHADPTEAGIWEYFFRRRRQKLHLRLPQPQWQSLDAFEAQLQDLADRKKSLIDTITTLRARARIENAQHSLHALDADQQDEERRDRA